MSETVNRIDESVRQVLAGERDAFRFIIDECEVKVRVILASMLPDSSMVDDVLQEVFVTVYKKLTKYKIGTDFNAWIAVITRNYARNEQRRWYRAREKREIYRVYVEHKIASCSAKMGDNINEDVLMSLRDCSAKLQEKTQDLIKAFYFEGKSGMSIAKEFGKKESWVRLNLFRARTAMADCMKGKGVFSSV